MAKEFNYFSTSLLLVLVLNLKVSEMSPRVAEDFITKPLQEETLETPKPEPVISIRNQENQCFHMSREHCPQGEAMPLKCRRIDDYSVFCCDVNNFTLKEGLTVITSKITNLHILNATLGELDLGTAAFRRLSSMAVTDGQISKIVGVFPKHSGVACLNISNNNLTSEKLESRDRPFRYLHNLTILDVSANNLTDFPLSLANNNRKISVDLSGNNYIFCKEFQKALESNNSQLLTFLNYNKTQCVLDMNYNWFHNYEFMQIDYLRVQKELNVSCKQIKPADINCVCIPERIDLLPSEEVKTKVAVDCSNRHLKEMPTNLPPNTIKLDVSHNNITSLQPVQNDLTYEPLRQLFIDYNDVQSIIELEGTKFMENFVIFSIPHNKLKTIHTYMFAHFDPQAFKKLSIAGNSIHCDCNAEKFLKAWLVENQKNIPDYKSLQCENDQGPVMELLEHKVCNTQERDWTEYIYYIITLEVLALVTLISKVSYDYWVFKTAGYLPWPANKMPRLPCDWLCE